MATKEKQKEKPKQKAKAGEPASPALSASFALRQVSPTGAAGRLQNVRLAFVSVKEPRVDRANPLKASYSVTALIPEKDFKAVYADAMEAVKGALKVSKKLIGDERMQAFNKAKAVGEKGSLFKKGDAARDKAKKIYDGFEGHYSIQIKSTVYRKSTDTEFELRVPFTYLDKRGNKIPAELVDRDFYSGCFAHVACVFATYDFQGAKGITCYFNGLMKVADADRLGASNPFADVEPMTGDYVTEYNADDDAF